MRENLYIYIFKSLKASRAFLFSSFCQQRLSNRLQLSSWCAIAQRSEGGFNCILEMYRYERYTNVTISGGTEMTVLLMFGQILNLTLQTPSPGRWIT